jgi:hypothetical protein
VTKLLRVVGVSSLKTKISLCFFGKILGLKNRHLKQNISKIARKKEHRIIEISTLFQTQMVQIGTISKHAYHVKF